MQGYGSMQQMLMMLMMQIRNYFKDPMLPDGKINDAPQQTDRLKHDNPGGPPPKKPALPEGAGGYSAIPALITAVIALSLALLALTIADVDEDERFPEPIIEWLPGILAIACAYSALWMLAYYCTGRSCYHLGIHDIIYLLKNYNLYLPYWFLEWIFLAYFLILIIELVIGKNMLNSLFRSPG